MASFDIEKEDKLKEKIKEKSKETAKAFAEEIKNMTDDKLLFLSFPFISDNFKVEFVRATYQELVKELNLEDAWEFDRVLDWFKDDKININPNAPFYLRTPRETSQFKDNKYSTNDEGIKFSHSSYSEALPYLLVEEGYITRINRAIFSELLFKLAEKDKAAGAVASAVANNFDTLPEDVRNLLFKLAEKDIVAWEVAYAVAANFDKLPEDVRNLLFKLAEKDKAAWTVAFAVVANFDKLPEDIRNLLFKLAEKDKAAWAVALAVTANFDNLPGDVRNLLFKLAEKDNAAWAVVNAVAANFDKLPEDVRNLLDKLQKPLQQVIEVYSKDEERIGKEQALHMISNALPKLNRDFVSKILKELSECEHETVRIKAAKMLKDIFDD